MIIHKKCKICSKSFITTLERIKFGRGKYCSRECQFKGMFKQDKVICSICDKLFTLSHSRAIKHKRHYCSKSCRIEGSKRFDIKRLNDYIKKESSKWLGMGKKGKSISIDGYYVYSDVKVHRTIMERYLKRKLLPTEIVHHINGDKLDNRIENLEILSRSQHNKKHHFLERKCNENTPPSATS